MQRLSCDFDRFQVRLYTFACFLGNSRPKCICFEAKPLLVFFVRHRWNSKSEGLFQTHLKLPSAAKDPLLMRACKLIFRPVGAWTRSRESRQICISMEMHGMHDYLAALRDSSHASSLSCSRSKIDSNSDTIESQAGPSKGNLSRAKQAHKVSTVTD